MRILRNRAKSSIAALVACSSIVGCNASEKGNDSAETMGTLGLALTIEGYAVSQVEVLIEGEDDDSSVSRNRTFDVSDPNALISATEYGLPEGSYSVSLVAKVEDDPSTEEIDETTIPCKGTATGVAVAAGATTEVNDLVLLCTVDGGHVQVAGGIRINAETQLEKINDCPDLIDSAFVAPLHTSVGSAVQLTAEHSADVVVQWSASAGTISADGTSYTCPDIPGVYTIQANFSRDETCDQVFAEQVNCHGNYEGDTETLPSAFAFTGNCGFASPCHLTQDGNAWQAVCGSRPDRAVVLTGEAVAPNSFPFVDPEGNECAAFVVDGELQGTCMDATGATCDFVSESESTPTPLCPTITELKNVTTCSGTYDSCEVSQDGCNILAKCGDTYLGRSVDSDGNVRVEELYDSMRFRCEGPTVDGTASGTCSQLGRGLSNPMTCDYSAQIIEAPSACQATLPGKGFVLEGCGFDELCFAHQQGCAWQITCESGVYDGLATTSNAFEFVGPAGASCSASAVNGEVIGSCGSDANACSFGTVDPVADASCLELPEVVTTRGCGFGSPTPFDIVQDGCKFLGYAPSRGVLVIGDTTPTGVAFPGISDGWVCTADRNDAADNELWGGCTRNNSDGSTSECRDLTGDQGARLVLGL